jgi:ubiquinone/menaquinone biosynthesis C-methylase UbiE
MHPVIIIVICAAAILVAVGFGRIRLPHRTSLEAIEDEKSVAAYDRISRWLPFIIVRRIVVGELAKDRPAGRLVDIGCGPGWLTLQIARRFTGVEAIGIDASDAMVEKAIGNAERTGLLGRVRFLDGDAADLPLPDASADLVLSTFSLHHWSDPALAFSEIHRVLRPGGLLLLYDLRRDTRRFFYWGARIAQTFVVPAAVRRADEPGGSILASYTPNEIEELFARSPFGECSVSGRTAWFFARARRRSG